MVPKKLPLIFCDVSLRETSQRTSCARFSLKMPVFYVWQWVTGRQSEHCMELKSQCFSSKMKVYFMAVLPELVRSHFKQISATGQYSHLQNFLALQSFKVRSPASSGCKSKL